jgi:hypothetical protein
MPPDLPFQSQEAVQTILEGNDLDSARFTPTFVGRAARRTRADFERFLNGTETIDTAATPLRKKLRRDVVERMSSRSARWSSELREAA